MATSQGIRVGIVGCGYWGSKHVRVMQSLAQVGEVVLIDGRSDRTASLLRGMPGARTFEDLPSALPEVDAVVLATPPTTHAPLALAAIAAGKHVLVEKPMATTSADGRRLVEAATEAGVTLMVGHTFEHNAAVAKLRQLILQGDLGDLYNIDTARLNLGLYQSDVNVIFDLAPHDISIIINLLGSAPASVEAWAACHAHRRLEDMAYLRLSYPELNLTANIHVSWLDPCKVRRVTVVGSRKMAVYDDLAVDERIRVFDRGVTPPVDDQDLTQPPMAYRYGDITVPYLDFEEPLLVQDKHFIDCILTGGRPSTNGLNGLAVVEVLEALQISLRERRPVALDELRPEGSRPGPDPEESVSLIGSAL
ncbi:Gfo/Idh/MocA family oxidoreductase [Pedococcus ginsenosidimutans]|jgi:predicted dehydrogenase|uniref:Gfo/Idh/MocA family oxidoreductase n=1 Tax=Pedococcus ginsenosidimutans TaxID=490570 RepID=A0ABP8XTY8_9MICO